MVKIWQYFVFFYGENSWVYGFKLLSFSFFPLSFHDNVQTTSLIDISSLLQLVVSFKRFLRDRLYEDEFENKNLSIMVRIFVLRHFEEDFWSLFYKGVPWLFCDKKS